MSEFVASIIACSDKKTLALQIAKALQVIETIIATYSGRNKEILREILETVVEFRVASVIGDAKQKEQSMHKVDQLYLELESTEIKEEQAVKLSSRITTIIVG